jgi:(p)ppGpp synthase/HD superfamily hydrolase
MSLALQAAQSMAEVAHKGQMYGKDPYTKHLGEVHGVLVRFRITDEDILVAAFLHDIVEDTPTTLSSIELTFGPRVADLVHRVTNESGKNRKERHEKTYPKIQASTDALTLKLADRIANVEASIFLGDKGKMGMYTKEYKEFREKLFKPDSHQAMWKHLDFIIGEV